MAAREFTTPVPRVSEVPFRMLPAARNWERIALKWRNIAERRRDHHLDLYKSGRWKHYYTDEEFLIEMRQAVASVNHFFDGELHCTRLHVEEAETRHAMLFQ